MTADPFAPISLRAAANATLDDVARASGPPPRTWPPPGAAADVRLGPVTLRGVPFDVGVGDAGRGDRALVLLRPGGSPVRVPVGRRVKRLVFAHRQLDSSSALGLAAGEAVATYEVRSADGRSRARPIRERFEIQRVPTPLGYLPFLAMPDAADDLMNRDAGPWERATHRFHECVQGFPRTWVLWDWRLDAATHLEEVVLHPGSQPVAVGAVTAGTTDEEPFVRTGMREVIVTLPSPVAAPSTAPYPVRLAVDRGYATYPQPLPDGGDTRATPGWGRPETASAKAYARISATADARVAIDVEGEQGAFRWGDLERDGAAAAGAVSVRLADTGRNWVHVTVVDETTGRPVPCRISFTSPDGIPFQPSGHHDHPSFERSSWNADLGGDVRLGDRVFAAIDGTCQGWLPRGEIDVEIARGFEYAPVRVRASIARGQRELRLSIARRTSMRERGWWSGDTHVHYMSAHGSLREQQAEDLNVVNLLAAQWGSYFSNTPDLTGRPVTDGDYLTYVSQEARQHVLGHLGLLGLTRLVAPSSTDGPGDAELAGTLDASLANWADACHEQGGTVVLPHFPIHNGEVAAMIATGRADAIEWIAQSQAAHAEYYGYLNAGYRVPLVGGTDKMSADTPVGEVRTYVQLPDGVPFSYDAWLAALRDGRTFLSSGHLIGLTVDGQGIGDVVRLTGPGTVAVEAWAESVFGVEALEIVHDGEVVAREEAPAPAQELSLVTEVKLDRPGWITARAGGRDYFDAPVHVDSRGIHAHTSPVYVEVGVLPGPRDAGHLAYMRTLVDGSLQYIRHTARHRPPAGTTHWHGGDHLTVLTAPLLDALQEIDQRLDGA